MTVVTFDHPCTGESALPLIDDVDEVVLNLMRDVKPFGNGCVGHFNMSSGANFFAMPTELSGMVEAAQESSRRHHRMVAPSALALGVALKVPKMTSELSRTTPRWRKQPSCSHICRRRLRVTGSAQHLPRL
jgi:hypothetical protein